MNFIASCVLKNSIRVANKDSKINNNYRKAKHFAFIELKLLREIPAALLERVFCFFSNNNDNNKINEKID